MKIKIRKLQNQWLVWGEKNGNAHEICAPCGIFPSWSEAIEWLKGWGWI